MQTVNLICVGSLKEKYLSEAVSEYSKRLTRYCKFNIIEISEEKVTDDPSSSQIEKILQKEGQRIQSKISANDYVIAMCIEGKTCSSQDLSKKLNEIALSHATIDFIIGGSWGLSQEVKNRAQLKLSVSPMTFPHQLFRVMLSEQIYRAFSINANSKYHK